MYYEKELVSATEKFIPNLEKLHVELKKLGDDIKVKNKNLSSSSDRLNAILDSWLKPVLRRKYFKKLFNRYSSSIIVKSGTADTYKFADFYYYTHEVCRLKYYPTKKKLKYNPDYMKEVMYKIAQLYHENKYFISSMISKNNSTLSQSSNSTQQRLIDFCSDFYNKEIKKIVDKEYEKVLSDIYSSVK